MRPAGSPALTSRPLRVERLENAVDRREDISAGARELEDASVAAPRLGRLAAAARRDARAHCARRGGRCASASSDTVPPPPISVPTVTARRGRPRPSRCADRRDCRSPRSSAHRRRGAAAMLRRRSSASSVGSMTALGHDGRATSRPSGGRERHRPAERSRRLTKAAICCVMVPRGSPGKGAVEVEPVDRRGALAGDHRWTLFAGMRIRRPWISPGSRSRISSQMAIGPSYSSP